MQPFLFFCGVDTSLDVSYMLVCGNNIQEDRVNGFADAFEFVVGVNLGYV